MNASRGSSPLVSPRKNGCSRIAAYTSSIAAHRRCESVRSATSIHDPVVRVLRREVRGGRVVLEQVQRAGRGAERDALRRERGVQVVRAVVVRLGGAEPLVAV